MSDAVTSTKTPSLVRVPSPWLRYTLLIINSTLVVVSLSPIVEYPNVAERLFGLIAPLGLLLHTVTFFFTRVGTRPRRILQPLAVGGAFLGLAILFWHFLRVKY